MTGRSSWSHPEVILFFWTQIGTGTPQNILDKQGYNQQKHNKAIITSIAASGGKRRLRTETPRSPPSRRTQTKGWRGRSAVGRTSPGVSRGRRSGSSVGGAERASGGRCSTRWLSVGLRSVKRLQTGLIRRVRVERHQQYGRWLWVQVWCKVSSIS